MTEKNISKYAQNRDIKVIPATQTDLDKYWKEQNLPTKNDSLHITDLVVADLIKRKGLGIAKYGTALQSFNGRNALQDLYEELMDASLYCKQQLEEDKVNDKNNVDLNKHYCNMSKENFYLKSVYIQANYISKIYSENNRCKSKLKRLWNFLFTNLEETKDAFDTLEKNIMNYRMSVDEQTTTNT